MDPYVFDVREAIGARHFLKPFFLVTPEALPDTPQASHSSNSEGIAR
jgi:hypothetical protein